MIKMLIVEDNKTAANMAIKVFKKNMDVDITVASTGEEALQLFKNLTFDFIMMDIGLGEGIDGIETTRRIRKIEAEINQQRCPIYALTAHSSNPHELDHHKNMGVDKTYKKPARKEIVDEILSFLPNL